MTLGRCVVVIPPEGGPYAFGGDRYRGIAESILAPHAEVHHIGWAVGSSAPDRAPWETIMERADALVVAPWLPLIDAPAFEGFHVDDDADLKVIAGTFDFRLRWIDLAEATRRSIAEQDALWRRLRAGELWAALDVFDPEPPPRDAWFRRAPNVLPTPHIAGNATYAHERCFREACADTLRVLRGEPRHPATLHDYNLYEGTITPPVQATSPTDAR